jgi:hypothetical protein
MKSTIRTAATLLCLALTVFFSSCELFEPKPDASDVEDVTRKAYDYILENYNDAVDYVFTPEQVAAIGPGTVMLDENRDMRTGTLYGSVKMTISSWTGPMSAAGFTYTGHVVFTTFAGDGSNPYVELSGEVDYTYVAAAHSRILNGTLTLVNGEDDNYLDRVTYDNFDFRESGDCHGRITADGVVFTYDGGSITEPAQ